MTQPEILKAAADPAPEEAVREYKEMARRALERQEI